MNFDATFQNGNIDFGLVRGNHKIVFIKPGLGSNCLGSEDKYLKMALRLRERYGCSVIAASNPYDGRSHVEIDRQIIERFASDNRIGETELFFFGHSNGGIKGLELAAAGVSFKKMVLVNMPLMINFHKTKGYLSAIPETEVVVICGEQDPSFPYVPFIDGKMEHVRVITVAGAEHRFKGMTDEFMDLSDLLLKD